MADIEYGEAMDEGIPSVGAGLANAVNWLGALVSVALIAGLAFWGYQLMVRDVSGVPVVRALEGPMRVAPENPGGQDTDHQGLAVNNIAAEGEAAAPAERLVLAPQATELASEDQTAAELQAAVIEMTPVAPDGIATDTAAIEALSEPAVATEDQASLIQATLLQLTENQDATAGVGQSESDGTIPATVAGVSRSQRPMLRPTLVLASLQTPATTDVPAGSVRTLNPTEIPVGTRLAQLGAFESVEIAQAQWLTFNTRFEDVMADKVQVIEKAQSGGKVFYRLRAHGFENLSQARQFCSALLAGQANCIPVVTR